MCTVLYFNFFIITIFILISTSSGALYYDNETNVFNPESFNKKFTEANNETWIVQFYHSYCGHCQNFAPKFKKFLSEANYWNYFINFGVIDCQQHNKFCHDQTVPYFPYFKLYQPKLGWIEAPIQKDKVDEFFKATINLIAKHNPKIKKLITPLKEKKENPYIIIRGYFEEYLQRAILRFSGVIPIPMYYQIDDSPNRYQLIFADFQKNTTKQNTSNKNKANQNTSNYNITKVTVYSFDELFSMLNYYGIKGYVSVVFQTESKAIKTTTTINKKENVVEALIPAVYSRDMYSSIWMALGSDVYEQKLKNITYLQIVGKFVNMLSKYTNLEKPIKKGLIRLDLLIQNRINSSPKKIMIWEEMIIESKLPREKSNWVGCNGSLPNLRRYPCGLWTTFHTMTVNMYLESKSNELPKNEPVKLIESIRDFIINFFSCHECAQNFKKETSQYKIMCQTPIDAMLYLWSVHNSVNQRLAGNVNEDPQFPKVRFPEYVYCKGCLKKHFVNSKMISSTKWNRMDIWNIDDVIKYLIKHYSNVNRIHYNNNYLTNLSIKDVSYNESLKYVLLSSKTTIYTTTIFNRLDLSICILFSMACSLLVLLIFIKFLISSRIIHNCLYNKTIYSPRLNNSMV